MEKVMEDILSKILLEHRSPLTADCSRLESRNRNNYRSRKVLDTMIFPASFTQHCWRQDQGGLFASCNAAFLSFLCSERIYRAQMCIRVLGKSVNLFSDKLTIQRLRI